MAERRGREERETNEVCSSREERSVLALSFSCCRETDVPDNAKLVLSMYGAFGCNHGASLWTGCRSVVLAMAQLAVRRVRLTLGPR